MISGKQTSLFLPLPHVFALQVLFYVQTDLVSCPLARHRGFGWINVASLIIIIFFNRSAFGAHYN